MHQQNPADAPPESCGTNRIRRTPTESCFHLQRDMEKSRRTVRGRADVSAGMWKQKENSK